MALYMDGVYWTVEEEKNKIRFVAILACEPALLPCLRQFVGIKLAVIRYDVYMLTSLPVNFDNMELDDSFVDWLWALKEFDVQGIVVLAPYIYSPNKERHAIAVHPPRLREAALQLAKSTDFFDEWAASRAPLVVWQTLTADSQNGGIGWRTYWQTSGFRSFVRVAFELPDHRAFECYLFSTKHWQTRNEPSMVAWSALNLWPELKKKLADLVSPLSPRELQCLKLAFDGLTARETAEKIDCSERTVNFHITNAMAKLKVDTKVAAIQRAILLGCM
jgi:LuxR family transcriptional regulator, quorum-sensing system regulator SolR